ncbi:AraC family transcriptional regulator [Erysipelothrix tonsillarum]|uniref:AraC family transcriptional regulator n=1 Tax=Erysipelothrix tonsillarum TaxID=38402 RepID=UPI00037D534C|nr:AraC family transcriptional regulator [Erysipelothrix tonsillarum]
MNNLYFEHYSFNRADSPLIVEHCEFDLSTAINAFYWHNDFEIILVKSGLCEIDIEDEVFTAMKDTVVFINPGQTRRIVPKTEGITLDRYIIDHRYPTNFNLDLEQKQFEPLSLRQELVAMLHVISLEYDASLNDTTSSLSPLTYSLFDMLVKYQPRVPVHTDRKHSKIDIVKQGIQYMHKNYKEELTLDQICRDIGISKFYYCRLFKEETDTTINNYLNEVRCHYAYELLSESNLRVGEVAKACGYNSTSYFTKIFKHLFGYPPSHVEKTVV